MALGLKVIQLFGKLKTLSASLTSHTSATSVHSATSSATASRIVLRDGSGRAQFADPSVAADVATKNYVDTSMAGAGTGTVTQVIQGTGVTVSPGTANQANYTVSLPNSGVTAATYTLATVTVDAQGRVTSASSGTAVTSVSVTSPLTKSGTTTPLIGIQAATSGQHGYMSSSDKAKLDTIATGADVTSVFSRSGAVVATTGDYNIQKISGVTKGTGSPSGGVDGDIYFQYS